MHDFRRVGSVFHCMPLSHVRNDGVRVTVSLGLTVIISWLLLKSLKKIDYIYATQWHVQKNLHFQNLSRIERGHGKAVRFAYGPVECGNLLESEFSSILSLCGEDCIFCIVSFSKFRQITTIHQPENACSIPFDQHHFCGKSPVRDPAEPMARGFVKSPFESTKDISSPTSRWERLVKNDMY